jgi:hypothetical protein
LQAVYPTLASVDHDERTRTHVQLPPAVREVTHTGRSKILLAVDLASNEVADLRHQFDHAIVTACLLELWTNRCSACTRALR